MDIVKQIRKCFGPVVVSCIRDDIKNEMKHLDELHFHDQLEWKDMAADYIEMLEDKLLPVNETMLLYVGCGYVPLQNWNDYWFLLNLWSAIRERDDWDVLVLERDSTKRKFKTVSRKDSLKVCKDPFSVNEIQVALFRYDALKNMLEDKPLKYMFYTKRCFQRISPMIAAGIEEEKSNESPIPSIILICTLAGALAYHHKRKRYFPRPRRSVTNSTVLLIVGCVILGLAACAYKAYNRRRNIYITETVEIKRRYVVRLP